MLDRVVAGPEQLPDEQVIRAVPLAKLTVVPIEQPDAL